MKFKDLDMNEDVLYALKKMGFEDMTPIQEKTYPLITEGKDICGLAQTGSGKTAACVIPLIQRIDVSKTTIQALVVVPTRELCIQYVDEIGKIAGNSGVKPFGVYGEFPKEIQAAKIKDTVHVLVATPGRLIDLMYDGIVVLSDVICVILDEADELLKEGFQEDVDFILSCIRQEHQTLLFSATMADPIKALVAKYLRTPEMVTLIGTQAAPKSLKHVFMKIDPNKREERLITYLKEEDIGQAIIFCNTRNQVDKLHGILNKKLGDTEYIHAGLTQDKRSSIFRRFKNMKIRFMIASDVAGRGLDFSKVTHVINWDFPREREQYTHRTGRAGRMGREGVAFTFISQRDLPKLKLLIKDKNIEAFWIGEDPMGGPANSGISTPKGSAYKAPSAQNAASREFSSQESAIKTEGKDRNSQRSNNSSQSNASQGNRSNSNNRNQNSLNGNRINSNRQNTKQNDANGNIRIDINEKPINDVNGNILIDSNDRNTSSGNSNNQNRNNQNRNNQNRNNQNRNNQNRNNQNRNNQNRNNSNRNGNAQTNQGNGSNKSNNRLQGQRSGQYRNNNQSQGNRPSSNTPNNNRIANNQNANNHNPNNRNANNRNPNNRNNNNRNGNQGTGGGQRVRYRGTTPLETIEITKIPVKKQRVPLGKRIKRLFGKED